MKKEYIISIKITGDKGTLGVGDMYSEIAQMVDTFYIENYNKANMYVTVVSTPSYFEREYEICVEDV